MVLHIPSFPRPLPTTWQEAEAEDVDEILRLWGV
jgi:hypothetical protein